MVSATVAALTQERERRFKDGGPAMAATTIRLVGQLSLFADEEFATHVPLFATQDCDAVIEGDWSVKSIFREVLEGLGLVYDDLSPEIWIPKETEWREIHRDPWLVVTSSRARFTILSKAVKAPAKNGALIRVAAGFYGPALTDLFDKYGVEKTLWR